MRRENNVVGAGAVWVVLILGLIVLSAGPVSGQYMVQPMKIELTPEPRERLALQIELNNESVTATTQTIDLAVFDLTQEQDGMWMQVEPGSEFDTSKLSSCRSWIKLGSTTVSLEPLARVKVPITVTVPSSARGFYGAAIMALMRPPAVAVGVARVVHYLIPVLVEVQGRPMRHVIELNDIGMEFFDEDAEGPATVLFSMKVANRGPSFPRLRAYATIYKLQGGHTLKIMSVVYPDIGIIPGSEFSMVRHLGRTLPSGRYRLEGAVYADGRRIQPLVKEIDFVGDPRIEEASADAAAFLEPADILMDNIPGGTRTTAATVFNSSSEVVNVKASLGLPDVHRGVAFGGLTGADLSCTEWVEITPEQFTLAGGGRQNIRITAKMPNPGKTHASYYTALSLQTVYANGQTAGTTTGYVCVTNKMAEVQRAATPIKLTLAAMEGSRYIVVARFVNNGNVHFLPRCTASAITPGSPGATSAKILLSGRLGMMLPLEFREFTGILDIARIPPYAAGAPPELYRLEAALECAPGEVITAQIPIRVSLASGQKVVEVVTKEEFEKVGVKW